MDGKEKSDPTLVNVRDEPMEEDVKKKPRGEASPDCGEPAKLQDGQATSNLDGPGSNEISKLTIKNVADHEKRCEEEQENMDVVPADGEIGMAGMENNGAVSLDEVVDTFSTMATDGSLHSFCGSCDYETKEDADAGRKDKQSLNNQCVELQAKCESTVEIEEHPRAAVGESVAEDDCNVGLDTDGNVVDADRIGEPNESQLARWEPDQYPGSRTNIKSWLSETARQGETSGVNHVVGAGDGSERGDDEDEDEEDSMATGKTGDDGGNGEGNWPMPPHKWNALKALRGREFGVSSTRSPDLFRYYTNGALHFVQRLELMYKMQSHEGCVNCLHFNESGTRLASGSDDLNVIIWDWTTSQPLLTIESGHRANIFQAKFMPLSGDCHLVTCARDGQVRLAELSVRGVCKSTRKLAQHRGAAHKLTLEIDSPHAFLSCGEDAVVFELDLRDPKPNKILVCKDSRARSRGDSKVPLYSIHSHPRNPCYFAVSGRDPYCRIYDKRMIADGADTIKKFCPQHLVDEERNKANVTAVVFNYDGTELLGTYNDEDIYIFNTEQSNENEYKHRYKGHRNNATVKGVNFFGPRSEFVVSGSDCGHIYFWEKESETVVHFMPGDEGGVVNVLEPHPTCAILATSGLDHDVKIWVPSCEQPNLNVNELRKLMRQNARERDRDQTNGSEYIDTQMLWYIMSRMRRAGRRANTGEGSDESGGDESGGDNSESDEEGGDGPVAVSCRPS